MSIEVLSVSQINCYIKSLFDGDKNLNNILISGEISNFTNHFSSGHIYFSLKDTTATIKCVMFKNDADRLRFSPQNGAEVLVRGKITLYEASGQYQLMIKDMQPLGEGTINLDFMRTKEKLLEEGLFEQSHKKELPSFPQNIGVITSKTGAVIEDIKNVLTRRFPLVRIILAPSLMQGKEATQSIIESIGKLNCQDIDVIIIARGGGSSEDLAPFNDETLARAIYDSELPIVSAVGHETDFTICDFVSDVRAATPSVAAELVSPNIDDIISELDRLNNLLEDSIYETISNDKMRLDFMLSSGSFISPIDKIKLNEDKIATLKQQLDYFYIANYTGINSKLLNKIAELNAMSPKKVLDRGYAIASRSGKLIKTVSEVKNKDELTITLIDGKLKCTVNEVFYEED